MHWAIKHFRKIKLSRAKCISLSIHDRKDYRLLRYRCSFTSVEQDADESKPSTGPQVQGPRVPGAQVLGPPVAASEGLLAVYKIGSAVPENTLETHDHDKAEAVQETVHEMIRRACQGPEGEVDDELHTHILTHVRHVATDQCPLVAKSMKMLANDPKLPSVLGQL